jgi:hypothetical protein
VACGRAPPSGPASWRISPLRHEDQDYPVLRRQEPPSRRTPRSHWSEAQGVALQAGLLKLVGRFAVPFPVSPCQRPVGLAGEVAQGRAAHQ